MSLKKKELLIIDDDIDQINLIKKILEVQGMRVQSAKNLTEANKVLKKQIPHIIILDLNLKKEESGYDFLKEKSKDHKLKNIPVIVQTSAVTKENVTKSLAFGAVDFAAKPLKSQALILKIKKHLKDFEFPQIDLLEEQQKSRACCEGMLTYIGEVSSQLLSPVRFEFGESIQLESLFLKSIDLKYEGVKTISVAQSHNNDFYNTRISFTGLSDNEAKKIRLYRGSEGEDAGEGEGEGKDE